MVFGHGAFACLNHLMVNPLENFTSLCTGVHSNMMEGMWSQVKKKKLKAMNMTDVRNKLPGYLDEFS